MKTLKKLTKTKKDRDPGFLKEIRKLPCIVCGASPPSTASHIKTRGSGGGDEAWNITPKCVEHHREWEGDRVRFLAKYPYFAEYLKILGWEVHGVRLWHPEMRQD